MKKIYSILLLAQMGVFAQAPVLVENFDYAAGTALTDNGWGAHSASATNPILTTAPGLTLTGYINSGIGNAAGVNNTGQDVNKGFAEISSGSAYVSFLINATASTADEYVFLIGSNPITTAFRARLFLQPNTDPTKFAFGYSFNSSTAQATTSNLYNFGETYLVVIKYTIVDGADNDTVSLYVFPAGGSFITEPATPVLGPLTGTAADLNPGTVGLRQFNANQRITVDGIRVSTIWDVSNQSGGVADNSLANVQVYPNPVTTGIITIAKEGSKQVTVFDVTGKKVLTAATQGETVDVSSLVNGVYIVQITIDNATVTKKLVVSK